MTQGDVLCAGIVVADHVCAPIARMPTAGELVMSDSMLLTLGGCAANVAVNLAKLGLAPWVVGRVGDDVWGRVLAQMLAEAGLETSGLTVTPGRLTSQTLIINVAGQDRRFIHHFGANADFTAADVDTDQVRRARLLYVGGYLLMARLEPEHLAELFTVARSANVLTVLDVAVPSAGPWQAALEKVLPLTDAFLPNQDEAALILGESDPRQQALRFREMGARRVAITLGAEGVVWADERERWRAGTYPTQLVDASGGGDAFAAGLIHALLEDWPASACLRWGSALGASCVRAIGTTTGTFSRAEADIFIAQHDLPLTPW
ncbi:MAG TPA: carbohydrate kinase family protein [Gemmatales bacterium]|nr:carbohydrate kinase family protein [Gemmatales bacterium]HMP61210.1 carbohydrate kinase family protein [Gemmatales bacterium]